MKTINQIKDCEAIKLGYNSFKDLFLNPKKDIGFQHLQWCIEKSMHEYASQFYTAEQVVQIADNWKHGGGSIYAYLNGGNMVGHNKLYTADEVREIIRGVFKESVCSDLEEMFDKYLTK